MAKKLLLIRSGAWLLDPTRLLKTTMNNANDIQREMVINIRYGIDQI